jgi:phospholipase C
MYANQVRFQLGWTQAPIMPPATTAPKVPHLALRIHFECLDSRVVNITGPDDITLPQEFWIEVRFHLGATQGVLVYDPEIVLSFLDDIEDHVLVFNIKERLEEKIKAARIDLFNKQWKDGRNGFDAILRPWLIGHYEVVEVEYDDTTDDVVIWHVGKPLERNIVVASEPPQGGGWTALPRLFLSAEDERLLPTPLPDEVVRLPPRTDPGDLAKVEHIVVLMQENRSFDQVLGYLSREGLAELGIQDHVDGLVPGDNLRDVNEYQFRPTADPVRFPSTRTDDTSWPFELDNPCHSRDCVSAQITGGMKSFVADYARRLGEQATEEALQRIMNYYGADELPVYAALAREFAICDHWFGSHIGGTLPNRHITLSGDLNRDRNGLAEEENSEFKGYAPSERPTFFDHLTAHDVSWRVFEHGYSFLRLYRNFTFDLSRIVDFDDPLVGFETLADLDDLPSVCFIEPDYIELPDGSDDHAPADMYNGQRLVARIVRALIRGGQWTHSMLIITYDEHGGFYDHLPPPDTVEVMTPDGSMTTPIPPLANEVRRLGPRVPAFVISPYVRRGDGRVNVSHTVYEHASIPATILRRFCGPRAPVMSPRVSAAHDLRDLLTLPATEPRPEGDFASLLQVLDRVADSPPRRAPGAPPSPVPTRKLPPDTPDREAYKEDFHGFIAYASATTGRSSPVAFNSVAEGRTMPGAPVTAVVREPGLVSLFLADPAGGVYSVEGNPVDGWGQWQRVSTTVMLAGSPITPVVMSPASISVFISDGHGNVLASQRNSLASWDPWRTVLPAATTPGAPVAAATLTVASVSLFVADRGGTVRTAPG